MTIVEKQFESIGILPVGETNPQIFLREPKHSFEYPVWSHSGDWIAFRQTDYGIHTDRPGIVRRDGTGKKIPDPIFGCMSPPTWSADDRLLGSIICTESGELPIVIDIETEMIFELFPNTRPRFSNSFPSQFGVSPKTMQAIFMGLVKGNPQSRELWLLNLDGSKQEQLSIPTEMATGCYEFPNLIAWSPDGEAFLVEFYEVDETECRASLWL